MARYAVIADADVIDILNKKEQPHFPPTNDGKEVLAVEIPTGVSVSIGMQYIDGEFVGEYIAPITPKTDAELIREVSRSQLVIMEAMAEQYEESLVRDLNNMETQATIYEAILELGGIE